MSDSSDEGSCVAIGARIASARASRGLTQAQAAARMGVTQTAWSNWESGKRELNVDKLVEVAKALRVEPETLLPDGPEPPPPGYWAGYGPEGEPEQWQLAAELLRCKALHADLVDEILGEHPSADPQALAIHVLEGAADALLDAADRVRSGHTEEACCAERQRRNRAVMAAVYPSV